MLRPYFRSQMHFGVRGDMICNETHFKLNRILLLAVGLWPYQHPTKARFQITLIFGILMISILFQLQTFVINEVTLNIAIKSLSVTLCYIIAGIQYISFWINMKTVRWSMEYLQHICESLKDEKEIAIMESYGRNTKRYTIVLILALVAVVGCMLLLTVKSMLGQNINVFSLMNETHPHRILLMIADYFVNRKKDLCLILLHTNVTICIGLLITLATGTMFIGYIQYTCGMFSIASYRIKQAINIKYKSRDDINPKNETIIHKRIICAVDIHRKAIEFSTFVIARFDETFFLMAILGVASLSFNIYRIFQILSFGGNAKELLLHVTYMNTILLYMFLANYIGQMTTDHYNNIFFTAYNVQWYITPLSIQRLIILLLQRGNKNFILHVGKLFPSSLEGFATLSSTSMSYFTVMYSTQKMD